MRPEYAQAGSPIEPMSVPEAGGGLPLVGHFFRLLGDPQAFLSGLASGGSLVGIRLGRKRVIVVCDPELTRQVLADDRTFDKDGPMRDRIREIFGDSVGTCLHDQHRWQRRMVQPAFHSSRLPDYAEIMSGQIAQVIDSWNDGQIIDVPAEMLRLTVLIASETMFAGAMSPQVLQQTVDDFHVVLRGVYRRTISPPLLSRVPTPANRRYSAAIARFRKTVSEVIETRRAAATDHGDLLSALLSAYTSADETTLRHLEGCEIIDQVITFLIAGSETTASLLAWALYLIDRDPQVKSRLHGEVDKILEKESVAGFEHVPDLLFTERILSETLRLYPPGWMFTRTATRDVELGGYAVPAGTVVLYSPYVIHHRADLYPRPDCFDPDRWGASRPKGVARHAFIPFGGGARKCIGDVFGMTQAVLAVASITAQWNLEVLPDSSVRPALEMALRPEGLHMRITSRDRPDSTEQ